MLDDHRPVGDDAKTPLPALPPDDASTDCWKAYFADATAVIASENDHHPEWTRYLGMVRGMLAGDRWATSPWRAWRAVEGRAEQQDITALMPFGRPNGGRTCLAAVAGIAQATVRAVVEELERGEAAGLIVGRGRAEGPRHESAPGRRRPGAGWQPDQLAARAQRQKYMLPHQRQRLGRQRSYERPFSEQRPEIGVVRNGVP